MAVYNVSLCILTFVGWFGVREPEYIPVRPSRSLFTFGHRRGQTYGILLIVPVRHRFPQRSSPNSTLHALFQILLVLDERQQMCRVPTNFPHGFERCLSGLQLRVLGAQSQGKEGGSQSNSSLILREPFYLLHHLSTLALLKQGNKGSSALQADTGLLSGSVYVFLWAIAEEATQPGLIADFP